ncbi:Alkylated DNA repair dioxygenase AlkB [Bradyrhizobium erythrophlei]|uniref:Alkylated DNA repair dioxygenase AlkB n=1 Tax=Bradyrhizobium erythrophlei TaxID=1437360 RepID=A0A1M5TAF1_9BRAD|nr:Alkylated DNA repair dioxygenase AlkB [Bradyrhizobium erythrophlei]
MQIRFPLPKYGYWQRVFHAYLSGTVPWQERFPKGFPKVLRVVQLALFAEEADPIPGWLTSIIGSVERFGDLPAGSVRQILCTEYDAGVGIGWHRDKPHFDKIFGLSLRAPCKFRFRRAAGDKWERFTLTAEPRSLYMMAGDSRQIWEHSIPGVEERRYSITFRTMRADAVESRGASGQFENPKA